MYYICGTHKKQGKKNYFKKWTVARRPQSNYHATLIYRGKFTQKNISQD